MKKVLAITMLSALALVSCTTAADGTKKINKLFRKEDSK